MPRLRIPRISATVAYIQGNELVGTADTSFGSQASLSGLVGWKLDSSLSSWGKTLVSGVDSGCTVDGAAGCGELGVDVGVLGSVGDGFAAGGVIVVPLPGIGALGAGGGGGGGELPEGAVIV